MVSKKMRRRARSESGLSGGARSGEVWDFHICRGIAACHGVFAIGLHINRRTLTVVDLACASQIHILRELSFFSQLSSSPLLTSGSRGCKSRLHVLAFVPIWSVLSRVLSRIGRIGCP